MARKHSIELLDSLYSIITCVFNYFSIHFRTPIEKKKSYIVVCAKIPGMKEKLNSPLMVLKIKMKSGLFVKYFIIFKIKKKKKRFLLK